MRKGISFFSGCGGSSLGYTLAGVKMIYANEFIAKASETYTANFPHTYMDTRDIRKIQPEEWEDFVKKFDENNDQRIDYAEFKNMMISFHEYFAAKDESLVSKQGITANGVYYELL